MVNPTENNVIKAIKEVRKRFSELRKIFSQEETKKIREKFHKKELVYNILKAKEQKDGLTKKHKQVLQNIEKYFKNFKKDLAKLQKYRYNITYDLYYLFNEDDEEDYYEPAEIKSAFDNSYIQYESRGDRDANLSLAEYLNIIIPYLREMIDNHKERGKWKIQLTMKINFVSVLDNTQFPEMHTKSDNIEIMIDIKTNDIITGLFNSLFKKYQEGLETKMKGSSFTFYNVGLLYYHFYKDGVVVITNAQLHSTKPELRFCANSNPARGVSEIRDGEDLWEWSRLEIKLNIFRRSTIAQKQFINSSSLNRSGSYIDSPDWLKHKKANICPKSNNDECFRYAIIAALNMVK